VGPSGQIERGVGSPELLPDKVTADSDRPRVPRTIVYCREEGVRRSRRCLGFGPKREVGDVLVAVEVEDNRGVHSVHGNVVAVVGE
jgi:hypothetical protein